MIILEDGNRTHTLTTNKPHNINGLSIVKLFEVASNNIDDLQATLNGLFYTLIRGEVDMKVAIVRDEKGSATNGGDFSAGAWRKRDLNTKLDPDNLVTVSNNSIVINVGGIYYVAASAPATEVYYHNVRLLRNGVEIALGENADCVSNHVVTRSRASWVGSLAVNDVLTLEHRAYQTRLTYGFGYASTITSTNIYSVVELFRLGDIL